MDSSGNEIKNNCLIYFENFSKKNISALRKNFADDIYLRDWVIEQSGIDNVIKVIENIFVNNSSFEIKPLNLLAENNQVSAEIEILINRKELIRVVDVIKFNDQKKIISIIAYKG